MCALRGLRIVVTRAPHQAGELVGKLQELGAEVIFLPMIALADPEDPGPLREAAHRWEEYDWIIFTSANAASRFAAEMPSTPNPVSKTKIAAIGPATQRIAEKLGFRVSITPETYVAESLAEAFSAEDLKDRRILVPTAAVTRYVAGAAMRNRGARVTVVEAYRNVTPPESEKKVALVFRAPYPDWVTFASPSAVDHLAQLAGIESLRSTKIASIGPITSNAVRKLGLAVDAEARVHTAQGIVDALADWASRMQ